MSEQIQKLVLAAFERGAQPMFVLGRDRLSVVASNARGRGLWGEVDRLDKALLSVSAQEVETAALGTPFLVSSADGQTHEAVLARLPGDQGFLLTLRADARVAAEDASRAHRLELMGSLARGVALDFKNVLQAIELAREDLSGQASTDDEEDAQLALTGVTDALALGGDLLAMLQSLTADENASRRRSVDALAPLRRCGSMMRTLCGRVATAKVSIPEGELFVQAEQGALVQLVMQLAMRARDAVLAGGGSQIWLEVERSDDGDLDIVIRDDAVLLDGADAGRATVAHLVDVLGARVSVRAPVADERGSETRVRVCAAAPGQRGAIDDCHQGDVWLVGVDSNTCQLIERTLDVLGLRAHEIDPEDLVRATRPSRLALCVVDLDALTSKACREAVLGEAMAVRERAQIPLVLVGGTLDAGARAQVSLLRTRGATVLRKPVIAADLLRALSPGMARVSEADAARPRVHEAS